MPSTISGFAFVPSQHSTAKVAQERADAELAKKLQMQLKLQTGASAQLGMAGKPSFMLPCTLLPPPLSKDAAKQEAAAAAKVAQEEAAKQKAAAEAKAKALPLPTFKPSKSLFSKDVKFCLKCGQGTTKDDRNTCKQCHAAQW